MDDIKGENRNKTPISQKGDNLQNYDRFIYVVWASPGCHQLNFVIALQFLDKVYDQYCMMQDDNFDVNTFIEIPMT